MKHSIPLKKYFEQVKTCQHRERKNKKIMEKGSSFSWWYGPGHAA
jgi:hypothetical protein